MAMSSRRWHRASPVCRQGVHRVAFLVLCPLGKTVSLPPLASPHLGQRFIFL